MIENQSKFQQTTLVSSFFVAIPVWFEATIVRTIPRNVLPLRHFHSNRSVQRWKVNDEKAKGQGQEKRLNLSRWALDSSPASKISPRFWNEKIRFFLSFFFFLRYVLLFHSSLIRRPRGMRMNVFFGGWWPRLPELEPLYRPTRYKFLSRKHLSRRTFVGWISCPRVHSNNSSRGLSDHSALLFRIGPFG